MSRFALKELAARLLATIIAVGVLTGAGVLIYNTIWQRGYDAREAEFQEMRAAKQSELFKLADQISAAEAELQARTRAMSERSRRIENEARADTGACRRVSPDSLQRLERRWGN